jgi:pyruvate,orthophosphate dikinase
VRFVVDYTSDLGGLGERVGVRAKSLAQMSRLGIPVPPGFAISDVVCRRFLETGDIPEEAWAEIGVSLEQSRSAFGSDGVDRPILFSVRSSPSAVMPGVLNSALFLGLTDEVLRELAEWGGSGFAASIRLGFLKTLGRLRGLSPARYQGVVGDIAGPSPRTEWTQQQIEAICEGYEALIIDESQRPIPQGLMGQIREGVEAVCASWDGSEARRFRRQHRIADEEGMGLVVHPMILGEVPGDSGAGTAFSRSPSSGAPGLTGIYTAGISRPRSQSDYPGLTELSSTDPDGHAVVASAVDRLESERRDLVRIDFIREKGRLWVIEARRADSSAEAAVRVAVDMVDEGLLSRQEALLSVDPEQLAGMLHPRLADGSTQPPIAHGTPASPGAACGPLVFSAAAAVAAAAEEGPPPILVLREVLPRDLDGVVTAAGLITSHGGGTSHAAVAARGAGTPSVTGIADVVVTDASVQFGSQRFAVGAVVTIDGATGSVFAGQLPIVQPPGAAYLDRLLSWADDFRHLGVWANADTALAAAAARVAGADGIGLARTEYMFHGERLAVVLRILLSENDYDRADALEQLENLQIEDFEALLAAMDETPVVVRLLDPPVHEFLPSRVDVEVEMTRRRGAGEATEDLEKLDAAIDHWSEVNPMLGLRGVRLAVMIPEIYRVQVLAALEAVRRRLDAGGDPRLELMIPLVGSVEELHLVRDMIEEEVHSAGRLLEIAIGTMIELPRAALVAGELALESDFFSFGTNDLTQTTMGLSRDDAEEAFLRTYIEQGVMAINPFQQIDPVGVGSLMRQAIDAGRAANPGLEIGVCGEHGGDPVSIGYFHQWGVDYVSCSPPRLPIARLAAAQAALRD